MTPALSGIVNMDPKIKISASQDLVLARTTLHESLEEALDDNNQARLVLENIDAFIDAKLTVLCLAFMEGFEGAKK